MVLNLDSRDKGVVVLISWVDNMQFRFKLDLDTKNILHEYGHDPDTYFLSSHFMWPTESDLLFTVMADFRANLLDQMTQTDNTTSCHLTTKSCVKMPDLFNLVQETLQQLYNIYTAYIPVLLMMFPQSNVLQTLKTHPVLFSVILPALISAFVLFFTLPLVYLAIQFVTRNKRKGNINFRSDYANESFIFQDFCECSETSSALSENKNKRKKKQKENMRSFVNWSLGTFLLIMIFVYPFSIKLTKNVVESRFEKEISKNNAEVTSWLVVAYKYLSIIFFDNKFNLRSGCSLISNPFVTGFWNGVGNELSDSDYGDKFLGQFFQTLQDRFDIFSAKLVTSSLTISFSTILHFITIYLMMQRKVFKTIYAHWSSGLLKRRLVIIVIINACLVINISRYYMCFNHSDIWVSFLERLLMMIICTPSSIVLEWVCLRLYYSYITILHKKTLELLSGSRHTKKSVLSSYLARGYLSVKELKEWKLSVKRYTTNIQKLLEEKTGHKFYAVDTGSIVERFGLPLSIKRQELDSLKTDHDVMFVPSSTLVSLGGNNINLINIEGSEEYFHLKIVDQNCKMLSLVSDNDNFIENTKDKILMKSIVTNLSMKDIEPKFVEKRTILGLVCINFTQRILKWDNVSTNITDPALNFKVTTSHLNHSVRKHDEWVNRVDCDFILAFHLDHWPEVASSWITRSRHWPRQEIISKIVSGGCEVVAKRRTVDDSRAWRLSFSMAEHSLSTCVGTKARKTYLAVKLIVKQKLKQVCPFLKSYHVKTIFFHFMETKTKDYWEETDLETTILDLLG